MPDIQELVKQRMDEQRIASQLARELTAVYVLPGARVPATAQAGTIASLGASATLNVQEEIYQTFAEANSDAANAGAAALGAGSYSCADRAQDIIDYTATYRAALNRHTEFLRDAFFCQMNEFSNTNIEIDDAGNPRIDSGVCWNELSYVAINRVVIETTRFILEDLSSAYRQRCSI